jgi:hypothetical protein
VLSRDDRHSDAERGREVEASVSLCGAREDADYVISSNGMVVELPHTIFGVSMSERRRGVRCGDGGDMSMISRVFIREIEHNAPLKGFWSIEVGWYEANDLVGRFETPCCSSRDDAMHCARKYLAIVGHRVFGRGQLQ